MAQFDPIAAPPFPASTPQAVVIGGVRYRLSVSRLLVALATRANGAGITTQAGLDSMLSGALTAAQQQAICKAVAEALIIEVDV